MVDIPCTEMSVLDPMLMGTDKIDAVGDSTEVTNVRIGIVGLTTDVPSATSLGMAHSTVIKRVKEIAIIIITIQFDQMIFTL